MRMMVMMTFLTLQMQVMFKRNRLKRMNLKMLQIKKMRLRISARMTKTTTMMHKVLGTKQP